MEIWKIIIPAVTTIAGVVLTYFLTKRHYDRKRKDDLADRDLGRRAVNHDKRIQEAKELVQIYYDIVHAIKRYEEGLIEHTDSLESLLAFMEQNQASFEEKISPLMDNVFKKTYGFKNLVDDALRDSYLELIMTLLWEIPNTDRILGIVGGIERFDTDAELDRVSDYATKAHRLLTKIQKRLDELSQTVS